MYRHTQLWKASAAANRLVRNSSWAACDRPLLPSPNNSPGPCAPAAATTWFWPAWAAIAQAAPAYTTQMAPSAR